MFNETRRSTRHSDTITTRPSCLCLKSSAAACQLTYPNSRRGLRTLTFDAPRGRIRFSHSRMLSRQVIHGERQKGANSSHHVSTSGILTRPNQLLLWRSARTRR
jgi:hypothetical protein